jgi:Subtilase family
VDIITLSFGCKTRVDPIYDAIKKACDNKILVFAAASNCGGNDDIAWPASMKDYVICVNATDGNGNATGFTPNALTSGDNFAVPGSAILSSWSEALGQSEMRMNGTSCAAPIAAGIGAIVLEFIRRTRARHPEFGRDADIFSRSKERLGMSKVFHKMVRSETKSRSNYAYIEPWVLFNCKGRYYDEKDVLRSIGRTLENAG